MVGWFGRSEPASLATRTEPTPRSTPNDPAEPSLSVPYPPCRSPQQTHELVSWRRGGPPAREPTSHSSVTVCVASPSGSGSPSCRVVDDVPSGRCTAGRLCAVCGALRSVYREHEAPEYLGGVNCIHSIYKRVQRISTS